MSFATRRTGLVLVLAFAFAPVSRGAPGSPPPSDEAQVVSAMETFYVALTNDDGKMFHGVVAPDFYAFDGGKRFEADPLLQLIQSVHAKGQIYVWRVTDPKVRMFGDTALITYVNRGSVQDQTGTKPLEWLESAFLQKQEGVWRILFFQSTRVP
jgi:hypothetical protein